MFIFYIFHIRSEQLLNTLLMGHASDIWNFFERGVGVNSPFKDSLKIKIQEKIKPRLRHSTLFRPKVLCIFMALSC